MKKTLLTILSCAFCLGAAAQDLHVEWENITSQDFPAAVAKADSVCIIPMGVLERHGEHLPLGTDMFNAHDLSVLAAQNEYCVVFPFYYVGQVNEARHTAGTVAYPPELVYNMLEETCKEVARNGFKKIILYSYHGGNRAFVEYFCMNQLNSTRDYIVYGATHQNSPAAEKEIQRTRKSKTGGHADELETATIMVMHPGLTKLEHANDVSGEDLDRLKLHNLRPGIWWYASYPNHYAGESSQATEKLGEKVIAGRVECITNMIKEVKADKVGPALQREFYQRADNLMK